MTNQDVLIRQIERTLNCEVETGPNGLVSSVYFPEITITNLVENRHHRITDLYVTIQGASLYGLRYSNTIEELVNKYNHSHLPNSNVIKVGEDSLRLSLYKQQFCIGTGELNKWLVSHKSGKILPEKFNFPFVMTLKKYLECESTEGFPHKHLRNLGIDNVSNYNNVFYSNLDNITIDNLLPVIKKSITILVSIGQIKVIVDRKKAGELILASRSVPHFLKSDSYFTYSLIGGNVRRYKPGSISHIIVNDGANITFKGRTLQYICPDNLDTRFQQPERYIVEKLEKQIQNAIKSKILHYSSSIKRDEWIQPAEGNIAGRGLEKDTLALW